MNKPDPLNPILPAGPATPCLSMRLREAAAALGVSDSWLWQQTKKGAVPCVRINGVVLFPVDALRRWLDEQAQQRQEGDTP